MAPRKTAKYGYKKDGTRKKKPGPKKRKSKSGTKKRKTTKKKASKRRKPRIGSCLYGRTAAGSCRKKAYKSRGGRFYGAEYYKATDRGVAGLGKAIYDVAAGPARQ